MFKPFNRYAERALNAAEGFNPPERFQLLEENSL